MRKVVAIIGDSRCDKGSFEYKIAYETGKILIDNGYRIQSGGMNGVMEAAFEGAHTSSKYREGDTIAIIPSFDSSNCNVYADIVIPTGLDIARNIIVVNCDAVIAIGGGAGTLSEIALSWSLYKLIIAYNNIEGWSKELAGKKVDNRIRYKDFDDKVFGVSSEEEVILLLEKYINLYNRKHNGISKIVK